MKLLVWSMVITVIGTVLSAWAVVHYVGPPKDNNIVISYTYNDSNITVKATYQDKTTIMSINTDDYCDKYQDDQITTWQFDLNQGIDVYGLLEHLEITDLEGDGDE